jgi:hypothetical protein
LTGLANPSSSARRWWTPNRIGNFLSPRQPAQGRAVTVGTAVRPYR